MHNESFIRVFKTCILAEGDLYFTVKLQNYTAVEKDEVILSCELSKAVGEVRWFKDGNEIFPSKNLVFQSDSKKRILVIKKAAKSNMGAYTCDCGTDKTTAHLNIEGNTCGNPDLPPEVPVRSSETFSTAVHQHPGSVCTTGHLPPILHLLSCSLMLETYYHSLRVIQPWTSL